MSGTNSAPPSQYTFMAPTGTTIHTFLPLSVPYDVERSGDRIPVARYSASVETGPGAHPASYTMGKRSFPVVKRPVRGVNHPPPVAQRLKKE